MPVPTLCAVDLDEEGTEGIIECVSVGSDPTAFMVRPGGTSGPVTRSHCMIGKTYILVL